MSNLKGKVAVVTGASKGIGAAIAKALAGGRRRGRGQLCSDKAGADKVVAEISQAGGKAAGGPGRHVQSRPTSTRLFAEAKQAFGRLDILVNNAGVFKFSPLEEAEAAEFHRQFDINVLGPILAAREAARHFGDRGGSIINVSSVVSDRGLPGSVVYSATKGALDAVTRVLARGTGAAQYPRQHLVAGHGGNRRHPCRRLHRQRFPESTRRPPRRWAASASPMTSPRLRVFLASDDSGWVTGERITVAGGNQL